MLKVLFLLGFLVAVSASAQVDDSPALAMPHARLGRSGLLVSRLSFGAWITFGDMDDQTAYKLMKNCIDNGVNFFDNAEAYHNGKAEEVMGRALQLLFKEGVTREQLVISTKIFFGTTRPKWIPNTVGLSRKHIVEGLTASLQRLQLGYVDVVFAHRPDPHTPMEEIVRAFHSVVDKGLAFYWCTSEWGAHEIRKAHAVADRLGLVAPVCEQPQYNLLHRERFEVEYEPLYQDFGMGTTIWSALSSGVLTGKYNTANQTIPDGSRLSKKSASKVLQDFQEGTRHGLSWEEVLARVEQLKPIATANNCTLAQLAVAWCLANPRVTTVILGATKPEQLADNFGSLKCLQQLTPAILTQIDGVVLNKPAQPRDWNPQGAGMLPDIAGKCNA